MSLYSQPLRVYLLLGVLALVGVYAGLNLPVSLFPNSSKPDIMVDVGYGSLTGSEFRDAYGNDFEDALRGIVAKGAKVERIYATYGGTDVFYEIEFAWGSDPDVSLKEVQNVVSSWTPRFPDEIRDDIGTWSNNDNSGFLAMSFYSDSRSLDDLYDLLDAALRAKIAQVPDADQPGLWNPSKKEVRIVLKPEAMADLHLVPRDVERALNDMMTGRRGGQVTVGTNQLRVEMPRLARTPDELGDAPIVTAAGRVVHLRDIATVDLALNTNDARIRKTSGTPSIILYGSPRPGGNVKRMAEDILAVVDDAMTTLPKDVHYRVLVDPSQFIRSSISNVSHEVILGGLLAVSVLFIFIGSLKNVITAAVEIPLSIVLAFILMRLTGINLNLISLGGLALSAGMNVDGSVVVMENIFRHFGEAKGRSLSAREKLEILGRAVSEVRLPLIASTVASLVVFLPLTFTSALSYAILGDLAKAVVFSHGFSAVVALILVPTVRLHLMSKEKVAQAHRSPFESALDQLDSAYSWALGKFIGSGIWKWVVYAGLAGALAALAALVLPKLPREVIGTPDSDMVFISMNTKGNTLLKQMESQSDEVERDLLAEFHADVQYTFTRINGPNRASILAKLADKGDMQRVWKALESRFTDTPLLKFQIGPWNPSELPIPDPPDLRVAIRGGDLTARRDVALEIDDLLESNHAFSRVQTNPNVERAKGVTLKPDAEQWSALARAGQRLTPADVADIARIATVGRRVARMQVRGRTTDIVLRYPENSVNSPEDLSALPVGVADKLVPLKALMPFVLEEMEPPVYRENGQDLFLVTARQSKTETGDVRAARARAEGLVLDWQKRREDAWRADPTKAQGQPVVAVEDPGKDVTDAIRQLGTAIGVSVLLIFLVLVLQFGSVAESLLVLIAVPLGFIGVILALYLGKSTLSLNSALGVILLNGIAVNNSIIMVDFIRRLSQSGMAPRAAALMAAKKRLRPILITSLTTILGMLPIALGFGEGGRILQPLGIAVSGGLWISMALTLFLVPALQVSYLTRRQRRLAAAGAAERLPEGELAAP